MRCLLSTWVMISPYISSVLTLLCTAICTQGTPLVIYLSIRKTADSGSLPHLNVRVIVEVMAETVIVAELHNAHLHNNKFKF